MDLMKEQKLGFGCMRLPELLDEILSSKYGNCLDFLQLQVNYIDWEQPNVKANTQTYMLVSTLIPLLKQI